MTGTILPFGRHRGERLQDVSDGYLFWLCDRGRSTYYKSTHSLDVTWRVPFWIWEEARKEADTRGYTKRGSRWEPK
jgi:hypothetical protein